MISIIRTWTLSFLLLLSIMNPQSAYCSSDEQEIKRLIQQLYGTSLRELLCQNRDQEQDKSLIVIPGKYFSMDFMNYYGENCKDERERWIALFDPRTGENDLTALYSAVSGEYDSQESYSNLKIAKITVHGIHATLLTTYDLPYSPYKYYGNYSLFHLIKENGEWKIDDIELGGHDYSEYAERPYENYKSVKQYIKESLKKAKQPKKLPPCINCSH